MAKFSPYGLSLVQSALLASFWRIEALRSYLRRSGVSESALAHLSKERTKRLYLEWLFPKLERHEKGSHLLRAIATDLARQRDFPDLEGWEDSSLKIASAKSKVKSLRDFLEREAASRDDEREKIRLREKAEQQRADNLSHSAQLSGLKSKLEFLVGELGTQAGGYAFQDWFASLVALFELEHKKPYRTDGREVDGSVTIDGTTYLLSLKFTKSQVDPESVSAFRDRVRRGADNTMGLFWSMSGFTATAVSEAGGPQTPLLLFDFSHIYLILGGTISLPELVARVRRHASRTGQAFLAASEFGA